MPGTQQLACLCFSKDRPLQLDGYIRSLKECASGPVFVTVLYTVSSPAFAEGYERVEALHPEVKFVRESNFRHDLSKWLRNVSTPFVMFGCDDVVFKDYFELSLIPQAFESQRDLFGFSLRLGREVNFCATHLSPERLPSFLSESPWLLWKLAEAEYDWGYAFELDCTVYRRELVWALVEALKLAEGNPKYPWGHPNTFEISGNGVLKLMSGLPPLLASFPHQKAVVVTVNRVQDVCRNGLFAPADLFPPEKLLECWNAGRSLDIAAYRKRVYNSIHVGDMLLA